MTIPKLIMVEITLNVFSKLIHFLMCCLISYHLYNKNILYCIFYEKKIHINYYLRFVSFSSFLYQSCLLFLAETSFYDTVCHQDQLLVGVEEMRCFTFGRWKAL